MHSYRSCHNQGTSEMARPRPNRGAGHRHTETHRDTHARERERRMRYGLSMGAPPSPRQNDLGVSACCKQHTRRLRLRCCACGAYTCATFSNADGGVNPENTLVGMPENALCF